MMLFLVSMEGRVRDHLRPLSFKTPTFLLRCKSVNILAHFCCLLLSQELIHLCIRIRISTDYGYVQQMLNVTILTRQNCQDCSLTANDGCGYIYQDTYGYVDFRQLTSVCGWSWWGFPYSPYILTYAPYQIQLSYVAGLPTWDSYSARYYGSTYHSGSDGI